MVHPSLRFICKNPAKDFWQTNEGKRIERKSFLSRFLGINSSAPIRLPRFVCPDCPDSFALIALIRLP